jgi:phosphatidylserine/phosphatidylglycerophosphate/cardiolipin synthase-like enzyme
MTELILNRAHYDRVIAGAVPQAEKFVWIATADIKDLHVKGAGRRFVPFLGILAILIRGGVSIRLVHAKEPGPRFREDFDRFPELLDVDMFERVLCPRMHTKSIIIDARLAYVGSANLTGAGIGAKSDNRRNFEAGIFTDDPGIVEPMMEEFDTLWRGDYCTKCGRREVCPDPII